MASSSEPMAAKAQNDLCKQNIDIHDSIVSFFYKNKNSRALLLVSHRLYHPFFIRNLKKLNNLGFFKGIPLKKTTILIK